ncbi:hypothetical protein JTE90_007754 [Oedothorax gibbosus]|uniref:Uncharacterized protein n=1 Tax=Oedothorax gibbosus TaxID=931172 RepID=A0AAV6UCK7_9ARAC|nr:hypothetical protein JTE90_007754 [Oedothorax gibbosus]
MAELLNDSFRQEEEENDRQFDRWSEGSRDEFWDALSSNYDYLMDDGLIATCREASSDLSVDEEGADTGIPEEHLYTFSCFMEQFRKLHDLLHDLLQGNKKEVSEDRQSVATMCRLFNEHAKHLSSRHPHLRDEIHRHLNLLNNKWLAVQATHFGHQGNNSKDALFHEIAGRMKSLRKWLREVEGRLSPVPSASSPNTLKDKHSKQTALQKEIEEKGRCVHSLRRACARLEGSAPLGASLAQWDAERVRRVAKNLEHRWHALWLSSLERQCALEEGIRNVGKEKLEASFSEEPLTKYPRLSNSFEAIARLEDELKTFVNKSNEVLSDIATTTSNVGSTPVTRTDKGIMVGDTGIAELKAECGGGGKFEIIQDVGYSSETSAHFSTDDKTEVKDKGVSPTTSYLKTVHMLNEERSFKEHNGRKSVPDTFYKMACVDDLAEDDDENDVMDHPPKTSTAKKKSRLKLERPNDVVKRSVCEWLDKYHLAEGSIETVIPSTTVEPSPAVRLRNKKRRPNRGRPWSVIELKSMAVVPSVPHSTSEGALDTLHRSTYIPCTVPSPSTLDESKTLLSETNSLVTTTEDQASISDQAWDEYQDPPYLSEPYSEQTIDEDEVRRLLNFGDDYRATLGSVSDGSSVSLRPPGTGVTGKCPRVAGAATSPQTPTLTLRISRIFWKRADAPCCLCDTLWRKGPQHPNTLNSLPPRRQTCVC